MKISAFYVLACCAGLAAQASADCEIPTLITAIPDGATATEQELLAVQTEIQAYVAAMDDYIACQNEELTVNGSDASAEYLFLMTTRIETARNEVDKIASDFNDQVTAFRAAREAATTFR